MNKPFFLLIIFLSNFINPIYCNNENKIGFSKIKEGFSEIFSAARSFVIKKRNDNPNTINIIKTIIGTYSVCLGIGILQDYYNTASSSTEGMGKLAAETNIKSFYILSRGILLTLYGGRTLIGVIDYIKERK